MTLKPVLSIVAASALVAAPGIASAQKTVTFSGDGRPNRIFRPVSGLNGMDANFLKTAAIINMFEIEAAKSVQDKGSSEFTKEFSKEMLADHQASLEELKQIAANKGVTIPSSLPKAQQHTINYLSNLSGANFDTAYRRSQVAGHEMASNFFKKEIDNGRDQDVKAYAVKTLPVITMHLRLANQEKTMMGPTKADHNG